MRVNVHSDADNYSCGAGGFHTFGKQTSNFSIVEQNVIWPFEIHGITAFDVQDF